MTKIFKRVDSYLQGLSTMKFIFLLNSKYRIRISKGE